MNANTKRLYKDVRFLTEVNPRNYLNLHLLEKILDYIKKIETIQTNVKL